MKKKTNRTRDMILAILFALFVMLCPCFLFSVCLEDLNPHPKQRSFWHKLIFGEPANRQQKK